jgi:hypothetical protein
VKSFGIIQFHSATQYINYEFIWLYSPPTSQIFTNRTHLLHLISPAVTIISVVWWMINKYSLHAWMYKANFNLQNVSCYIISLKQYKVTFTLLKILQLTHCKKCILELAAAFKGGGKNLGGDIQWNLKSDSEAEIFCDASYKLSGSIFTKE